MEVECVREGCQSETLRRMGGSVPEGRCLTVVFKGPRKSLDLLCSSQEEAQHWVRGIRTLQERVDNMTHKEKLDQYPLTARLKTSNTNIRAKLFSMFLVYIKSNMSGTAAAASLTMFVSLGSMLI